MYIMDFDRPPSRPVVPSHASASSEFSTWVRHNSYETLVDGAGLRWDVQVDVLQLPDPNDLKASIWSLEINVTAEPKVEELFNTGTLSKTSESDRRLGELLETISIPLRIRTIRHSAASIDDLRSFAIEMLPKLKEHLGGQAFHDLKRRRAATVIDQSRVFGAPLGL